MAILYFRLATMFEMYDVLHEKMLHCKKPIFPILPSINTAGSRGCRFPAKGHVALPMR